MQTSLDESIAGFMADHRTGWVTDVARLMEDFGRSLPFLLLALVVVVALSVARGGWRLTRVVLVVLVVTAGSVRGLKSLIDRPRPSGDLIITVIDGSAMPSTHAAMSAALVTVVVALPWWTSARLRRGVAIVGAAGCLVTGAAMVYLGGHWFTDLLVGWALGVGVALGLVLLVTRVGDVRRPARAA